MGDPGRQVAIKLPHLYVKDANTPRSDLFDQRALAGITIN